MSEAQINWFKKIMETASNKNNYKSIKLGLVKFRSLFFSPNQEGILFYFILEVIIKENVILLRMKLVSFKFQNLKLSQIRV